MKRRRNTGSHPRSLAGASWLTSFTDLLCLLLCFFILSFSMSEPVYHRWQAMFGGPASSGPGAAPGALFSVTGLAADKASNLDYLTALLRSHLESEGATASLTLERWPGELRISLPSDFAGDGGTVGGDLQRALFFLGAALARIGNRVEIIGQAEALDGRIDAVAVRLRDALWRAVAVARSLADAGLARPLVARAEWAASEPRVVIVIRDWRED